MLAPLKERYDKPRQHIKKQRHHFPTKFGLSSVQLSHSVISKSLQPHVLQHMSLKPWKALSAFSAFLDPRLLQSLNPTFSTEPLRLFHVIHSAVTTDQAAAWGWALGLTEARRTVDEQTGPYLPHTAVSPPITPSLNHNCASQRLTTHGRGWVMCHAWPLMLTSLEKQCNATLWKKQHRLWHPTVLGLSPSSAFFLIFTFFVY